MVRFVNYSSPPPPPFYKAIPNKAHTSYKISDALRLLKKKNVLLRCPPQERVTLLEGTTV